MKLRYYLRGLGVGILVTALILTIVPGEKEVLSDAEIRERALQLGMVDASSMTLADVKTVEESSNNAERVTKGENTGTESVTQGSDVAQENDVIQESDVAQENDAIQESDVAQENDAIQESDVTQAATETPSDYVMITIKSGDGSYTVAKALEDVGLIADAGAFDAYLCDNGYSRTIGTGTYEIAFGSTEEEIAKIISRKR